MSAHDAFKKLAARILQLTGHTQPPNVMRVYVGASRVRYDILKIYRGRTTKPPSASLEGDAAEEEEPEALFLIWPTSVGVAAGCRWAGCRVGHAIVYIL